MSALTGQIATAWDKPANSPSVNTTMCTVYPVAGTPSHKTVERGVNVSRQEFSPPSRLSLRARIIELEWAAFRALPPQGKRNKITTSLYLMRCQNAKKPRC